MKFITESDGMVLKLQQLAMTIRINKICTSAFTTVKKFYSYIVTSSIVT